MFVNGHLALDLGGLHVPEDGSVTFSGATADDYDIEDGKVYCGDGIVDPGETCDDGDSNKPAACKGCRIIIIVR